MRPQWWTVPRLWGGERCFIVAGGPSVAEQNTESLRGHHVIAVNSSWKRVPFAEFMIFGDTRWWWEYHDELVNGFPGQIVCCAGEVVHRRVLNLKRTRPPGLCETPDGVVMRRTSLAAAINFAAHLGVKEINLLGADGGPIDGKTHHHESYPWDHRTDCWKDQRSDLQSIVKPLQNCGINVTNCSPRSMLGLWPISNLSDVLNPMRRAADALPPLVVSPS
jgi:hypothetical protein